MKLPAAGAAVDDKEEASPPAACLLISLPAKLEGDAEALPNAFGPPKLCTSELKADLGAESPNGLVPLPNTDLGASVVAEFGVVLFCALLPNTDFGASPDVLTFDAPNADVLPKLKVLGASAALLGALNAGALSFGGAGDEVFGPSKLNFRPSDADEVSFELSIVDVGTDAAAANEKVEEG